MKVSIEKPFSYQMVLAIEVPSETVEAKVESLYTEVAKTATHPGFRKGRVPRKILKAKLGKSIRQEAIETTVASSVGEALKERELVPLTDPEFGEIKFDDGGPLSFEVTIEVSPEVELGDYKGIELKRPKTQVTEDDVASVIERLRTAHAKYIPADRPVEKGDFIVFDFEAFEDDKPLENARAENFPLEVGSGAFGEDFESQLVGAVKEEKRKITVEYPEDYKSKDLAGKQVRFDVTVKDVKLRERPELDDDFAKDLGEHSTLKELKESLKGRLEKDMEKRMEHFLREQAIVKITSESKMEMPPKLKARVSASVFEEEIKRLVQQGADRETIATQRDKIAEFAEAEAERQLKLTFVTDEIAQRENLGVSEEELESSLEEMARESEEKDPRIRDYFKSERVRERYRDQLRVRKILDFIVSGAKIEEVEETEAEAESTEHSEEKKGES